MKVKEMSEKVGLKLNIQKNKNQGIWSHHSMENRWGKNGNSNRPYFRGLQNHCRWWLQPWIKNHFLLGRKAMTNLDSRDITFLTKVYIVKDMVFPVVMYGYESWTIKKAEHQRTDAFQLRYWRRLLRVPWATRRSNQSILKEINPKYHWKDWLWSWNSCPLATWCKELTHWKRTWCWERLKVGERDDRGWDGWIESPTWWTGVWASSKRCCEGQGRLVCCSPWGRRESDMPEWLNNMLIVIEYGRPLLSNSLFHIWWIILKLSHLRTSWTSNTLATWCEELTHWKRPWSWEKCRWEEKWTTEDEVVGWHHRRDGHELVNSGSWWWTGKPGVVQSMGSQRVGHDWATELNWISSHYLSFSVWLTSFNMKALHIAANSAYFLIRLFGFLLACLCFAIELHEFLTYFQCWSLNRYMICKYFLLFPRLSFHFVGSFLCCAEAFYFDVEPLVYFWFFGLCVWRHIQKHHSHDRHQGAYYRVSL